MRPRITVVSDIPQPADPYSNEAEKAVLVACLARPEALGEVAGKLVHDDFDGSLHKRIADVLLGLHGEGRKPSIESICAAVGDSEVAPDVSMRDYLKSLIEEGMYRLHLPLADAIETVLDASRRRKLSAIGANLTFGSTAGFKSVADLAHEAMADVNDLMATLRIGKRKSYSGEEAAQAALDALAEGRKLNFPTTGLVDLDRMLGGWPRGQLSVVAGRPGMGKAQPLNAKILMRDGSWKSMGDLRMGDALASVDGAPSRVSAIYPQGEKAVYRVTFSDGRSTECCDDHLWSIHYRHWDKPRVVPTSEVRRLLTRKRYQKRLWTEAVTGHFGHSETLPIDPYALGALLGDGSFREDSVRFTTASRHVLESLKVAVGSDVVVAPAGDKGGCMDYRIRRAGKSMQGGRSNPILTAIRELGLKGLKSQHKFIPEIYKSASREARIQLLRGLLDTDGWVETFGAVCYGSTSHRLASDVVDLVRSIGGGASLRVRHKTFTHKGVKKTGLPYYFVGISYSGDDLLVTEPHKAERVRLRKGGGWRRRSTILSIEPKRVAPCQCIRVTHPSHLYVTDDYVVTHNSLFAVDAVAKAARAGFGTMFFSLEMLQEQIGPRLLTDLAFMGSDPIAYEDVLQFRLTDERQIGRLQKAKALLDGLPIHIEEERGLTVADIIARAEKHASKLARENQKLDLVVVDHIGLVRASDRYRGVRHRELAEISDGLATLAKDLGVAVVALCQLNRGVEGRDNKRPSMADLRESGAIEEDASVVAFLYRASYYLGKARYDEQEAEQARVAELERCKNLIEIAVDKNRNGRVGIIDAFVEVSANALRNGSFAR